MSEAHKILGVGPRCAEWLRRQYPHNRGKLVARDFYVHENTAWRWLKGVAPTTAHLEEMYSKWGRPWLEFVFVEAAERSDPRLSELETVQRAIDTEMRLEEEEQQRLQARRAEIARLETRRAELAAAREGVREQRVTTKAQRLPHRSELLRVRRLELLGELSAATPRPGIWVTLARSIRRRSRS